jgi:DMSO reductase anchor subunit
MHPALSVIFFTTLSGAGYGLWFLLGLSLLLGEPYGPSSPSAILLPLGIGFVLVSTGLLASVGHLGQPQRAWRAFSQWRSSWLSREGVASLATYLPALALATQALLALRHPGVAASPALRVALGAMLMAGCVATVWCTARIYSSLKPVAAWNNAYVLPGYLLLALYSGALWAAVCAAASGATSAAPDDVLGRVALVVLALASTAWKLAYWQHLDTRPGPSTPGTATGLDPLGQVRSVERPHTEDNYLLREMGFVLARKHAARLRALALALAFGLPLGLVLLAACWPASATAAAWLALLAATLGLFVERWLFFAQARHTVTLYYGAQRA